MVVSPHVLLTISGTLTRTSSHKIRINFKEKGLHKNFENILKKKKRPFWGLFRRLLTAMTYLQETADITTIKNVNEYPTSATFCSFFMQRLASVK